MTTMTARPAGPAAPAKTAGRKAGKTSKFLIDVSAAELHQGLRAVMAHAHRSSDLPSLNGVHFDVRDGKLYLAATDRYTIGLYLCLDSGKGFSGIDGEKNTGKEAFSFTVPLDVCKLLMGDAKQAWISPMRFTLTRTEDDKGEARDEVKLSTWRVIRNVELEAAKFVPYWDLVAGIVQAAQNSGRPGVLFSTANSQFQARFALAQQAGRGTGANAPMVTHHIATNKPTVVIVGQQFCGLIMPVRVGEQPAIPSWVPGSSTPVVAPSAAPAPAVSATVPAPSAETKAAEGAAPHLPTPPPVTQRIAAVTKAAGQRVVDSGPVRRVTPAKKAAPRKAA